MMQGISAVRSPFDTTYGFGVTGCQSCPVVAFLPIFPIKRQKSTFLCAAYTALGLHRKMITVIKPQLATARLLLHASELSICLSVCLSVRLSVCRQNAKKPRFSQKLSNLELRCLLTTCRKSYIGFLKNPLLDPYNPRWLRYAILKINMTSFFSAEGGPIWIKFRRAGTE